MRKAKITQRPVARPKKVNIPGGWLSDYLLRCEAKNAKHLAAKKSEYEQESAPTRSKTPKTGVLTRRKRK